MKTVAVILASVLMTSASFAQDFSRFKSFEENSKGKEIVKLEQGKWLLEDCLSEENIHIRNFSYIGDSISEKVSIMVSHHNFYELGDDMVDHVGAVLLDETRQKFLGQNHLFLYRKGGMKDDVYAIIWLTAEGEEKYFELEG